MANTYKWIISKLDCVGNYNAVLNIHWRRTVEDEHGNKAETQGMQTLTSAPIPGEPFVPYSKLTFEQICAWLEHSFQNEIINKPDEQPDMKNTPDPDYVPLTRMKAIDALLDSELVKQVNPPVVAPPLPWEQ